MISSTESLQLILFSLTPKTSIDIEFIQLFESERLGYPRQSRLATIGNQFIVIGYKGMIVYSLWARIIYDCELIFQRVVYFQLFDCIDPTSSIYIYVLIILLKYCPTSFFGPHHFISRLWFIIQNRKASLRKMSRLREKLVNNFCRNIFQQIHYFFLWAFISSLIRSQRIEPFSHSPRFIFFSNR